MPRSLLLDQPQDQWLAATESQRRTGIARHGLLTLALAGKVRSDIRAGRVFYNAEDIDSLARERAAEGGER
jgi:hypothetical protein